MNLGSRIRLNKRYLTRDLYLCATYHPQESGKFQWYFLSYYINITCFVIRFVDGIENVIGLVEFQEIK